MNKRRNSKTSVRGQKRQDTNPNHPVSPNTMDLMQGGGCAAVMDSVGGMQEMKAYVSALNEYKHKMSAIVEDIIKSVDASRKGSQENSTSTLLREKISEGNPSNIMECGIPLVVEPPLIHDASHIINDTFREHLCRELPGNKRKLFDSTELKEHLSLIEEIRRAEKDVMEVQERLLKTDDRGSTDIIGLSPWNVEKYSLLCPRRLFVNNANEEKEGALKDDGSNGNCQPRSFRYGIHDELRRLRLRLNKERPKLNIKYCLPEITRVSFTALERPQDAESFSVSTDIVYFSHYAPGGIYQKTIKITNTGKRLATFRIMARGDTSRTFQYDYAPRGPLAAGLSAKLTVTFNCTSTEDIYGWLYVTTRDGRKTEVLVCAENHAIPALQYSVESYEMVTAGRDEMTLQADTSSSAICVFDCNACLVGAVKTIPVPVKNLGRSAKFILVPEDVWYTKSVEDVEWTGSISSDAFTITPSIFEINDGQSMTLSVVFKPRFPMFYCSRFIIVSDNSCANELNVFGDGQMFSNGVWLEGQGLLQSYTTDGSYVLDMGKIGEVVQYVYAKNTSRIKYPYRWIINHGIVGPGGAKIARVHFNVHPSTGTLDKFSRTEFQVECRFDDDDDADDERAGERRAGEYRATATMMIDGIPKASINGQNVFFEEQEDSPETLSIRVAEIELMSVYKGKERVSLRVEPVIVDMNRHRLRTDSCVEETLNFVNDGSSSTLVSWIPESGGGCVRVEPERFVVTDRTTVRVLVEPVCVGRLRETLKFRAVNDDDDTIETAVYVRGTVDRKLEVLARSPTVVPLGPVCAGRPESYAVELQVTTTSPFCVQRRLYEFDDDDNDDVDGDTWSLRDLGTVSYGPYETGSTTTDVGGPVTLRFETPVNTEVTTSSVAGGGVSCQLAEWSLAGSVESAAVTKAIAFTQSVTYAVRPDVRLNVNAVTVTECLYRGVSHTYRGIRLFNSTPCEMVYSWGIPMGSHADSMDCAFKPAVGTVDGNASVEFELIMTPKSSGQFDEFYVPFFVQCDTIKPQQLRVRWRAEGFSVTISYADRYGGLYSVMWRDDENQWIVNGNSASDVDQTEDSYYSETEDNPIFITNAQSDSDGMENSQEYEIEPEDREPAKWRSAKRPRRDVVLWSAAAAAATAERSAGRVSDRAIMAFEAVECDTAAERRVTVQNTTGVPCRVTSAVGYYGRPESRDAENTDERDPEPRKRCFVWLDPSNDRMLDGWDELCVSVWTLATTWGRYEDTVTFEIGVGNVMLPAVCVKIVVVAVTFPLEFPLVTDMCKPTVNFSLYSMTSEQRLQVVNKSEIPVQVSWRTYNKNNKKKKPFEAVYDTSTSDDPDQWSFRINRFYGSESPRYFVIKPIVLKLGPKEQGFVTLHLDRTKEVSLDRDENNMAYGKAVGMVTALEPPGKHCTRDDGFKLKPAVVKLYSETRHSIRPNFIIRELDNSFQISATRVYESRRPPYGGVTRWFSMLNLLRYPANFSFEADSPFIVKSLKTLRCGLLPGNSCIRVFYEDLVQIELQANVVISKMIKPKMPTELTIRKSVQVGHLYAFCEHGYYKPKPIGSFEVHVRFPVLIPSTDHVNFGRVSVRESKSVDVTLSAYSGPERFAVRSGDAAFTVSPAKGVTTSHTPSAAWLTVTFRPKTDVRYSNVIEISTTIPKDVIFIKVTGVGIM